MSEKSNSQLYAENVQLRQLLRRFIEADAQALAPLQAEADDLIRSLDHRHESKTKGRTRTLSPAEEERNRRRETLSAAIGAMWEREMSIRQIAAELNRQGVPSPMGGEWKPGSVHHYLPKKSALPEQERQLVGYLPWKVV
jgi:hypothetical protein